MGGLTSVSNWSPVPSKQRTSVRAGRWVGMTSSVGVRPVLLSSGDVGGLSNTGELAGALEDEEGSNGTGMTECVEGDRSLTVWKP